mmetsp:Transcript_112502/g.195369  ORF Transcript_112502/g.195369 Transcript_112502/m.195369 type:complete len:281 (-) Transcript_112502:27-869(-)
MNGAFKFIVTVLTLVAGFFAGYAFPFNKPCPASVPHVTLKDLAKQDHKSPTNDAPAVKAKSTSVADEPKQTSVVDEPKQTSGADAERDAAEEELEDIDIEPGSSSIGDTNLTAPDDIPGTMTVIVTQYKRSTLELLIAAMRKQTVAISQIIVYQNMNYINDSVILAKGNYSDITFVHNVNYNTGFFGRFSLPLILRTEYVAVFDDDSIPSKAWLENCVRIIKTYNAICGANGRVIIPPKRQMLSVKMPHPKDVEVDFVGHSWVFKKQWAHHMWRAPPPPS